MATVEGRVICWWKASLATSCYLWFPPRRVFLVLCSGCCVRCPFSRRGCANAARLRGARTSALPATVIIFGSVMVIRTRYIKSRRRPYRVECTGSLLTSEVKQHRARLVLGWGTAWEDLRVLSAFLQGFVHHGSANGLLFLQKCELVRNGLHCVKIVYFACGRMRLNLPG